MSRIPFNKPHLTGKETHYIYDAVQTGKLSGNGKYTRKCHAFFESTFRFRKCLLTSSCTDALEMAALLLDIQSGDEVIMPSYTFVSTANPFVMRGAHIRFADSKADEPNMDIAQLEPLINENTKAIVVVHYAGVATDMAPVMALAEKYNLFVVEDAAHSIQSYYYASTTNSQQALGSIGHLATFSFHETKNIISGEGGMLVVNDERFIERSEILWEKGTNRAAFFRGEVDKYGWVDIGSSFLPSEMVAAFLWAQLEQLDDIQSRRKAIWQAYDDSLRPLAEAGYFRCPVVPTYAYNNAHMYYIVLPSLESRSALIDHLRASDISAVFHYLSLHESPYFRDKHDGRPLPESDRYSDTLLRLPFFYDLNDDEQKRVIQQIMVFFAS